MNSISVQGRLNWKQATVYRIEACNFFTCIILRCGAAGYCSSERISDGQDNTICLPRMIQGMEIPPYLYESDVRQKPRKP
jgi:hypothetical protein